VSVEERLAELGLGLPQPIELPPGQRPTIRPLAADGDQLYLSGIGPFQGRRLLYAGKVGAELTLEQGRDAARVTALNHLRVLVDAGIDLDRLRWVKVLGMVNSAPTFTEHPAVVNGYSELVLDLFGEERGLHARSAVGMASLPWNMAVEVEAICRLV
jgi:enamine deaminase RidA (YjgF/YER057c/UK114 family)